MSNYLVYWQTNAHVDMRVIIGIASDFTEVIELLWNHTLFSKSQMGETYEEKQFNCDTVVAIISDADYNALHHILEEHENDVETRFDFEPEDFHTEFWQATFETDMEDEEPLFFTKKECQTIKRIVKRSKRIT